jgi:hypothetical protein
MALIEIDESEYEAHKKVTASLNALLSNPKTRRKVLEAQKELNPSLVIPELDAAEPFNAALSELTSTVKALADSVSADRDKQAERERVSELQRKWNKGRSALRASGYTDEGIEQVEKFMEEKGVADHEVGAAAFERLNPPQTDIRPVGGNRFDIFDRDDRSSEQMKALYANPNDEMALSGLINDTLKSVRGR